jgi:uncharacterized alpha-E superfamily protein
MLSRVADSLYWMSRYFERVDHCARVLEANHTLTLNPSMVSVEQRWRSIANSLGFSLDHASVDTPELFKLMITDASDRSSMSACLTSARENASQVREQITSDMWERLNQLYHEVTQSGPRLRSDSDLLRLLNTIREGAYRFYGVTDQTMSHDEGWQFIQLGKFMERACAVSTLLDAHFLNADAIEDVDWTGLLTSCSAFEAYCKVYTADLSPERVAEFLVLHPEFPYSVRYSAEQMYSALEAIAEASGVRKTARIDRIIGQLRSSLAYAQIEEILARDLHAFLRGVIQHCANLHIAFYQIYIDHPIESAFEA